MKKLIALIVAVMVMMGMCATTFAATNPKVAENGAISINGEGAFVLDATKVELDDDENIANNSQTTVVVVAGQDAAITTTSIQYINQDSATSFTFIPKDDAAYKAGAEAVKLTAYIGGDEITKATAGYIDYELVAPTMYTVTFKNGDETLATAQCEAGTVGVAYSGDAPTKAEDETNTYAFSHWYYVEDSAEVRVDDLATLTVNSDITLFAAFTATAKPPVTPPTPEEPTYTYDVALQTVKYNGIDATVVRITGLNPAEVAVTVDETVANYYVRITDSENVIVACIAGTYTDVDAAKALVSVSEGTTEAIAYGNSNGTGIVDVADVTDLARKASNAEVRTPKGTTVYSLPSDLTELHILDLNADGKVDVADVTLLARSASNSEVRTPKGTTLYSLETMDCYKK